MSRLLLSTVLSATLAIAAVPAFAQAGDKAAAASRIAAIGNQQFLVQRMARDICFAELGIDSAANLASLAEARDAFRAAHTAIKDGSADAGLAPLEAGPLSDLWADLDEKWQKLEESYTKVEGVTPIPRRDFDSLVRRTAQLFDATETFLAAVRDDAVVTREAIDGATAAGIFNYSRQLMLAEKMTKEGCLLLRGDRGDGPRFEMQASQTEFDDKMVLFQRGNPFYGVPAPATPEIGEALASALADWEPARPVVIKATEGNGIDEAGLATISSSLEAFIVDMGKATSLYVERARQ